MDREIARLKADVDREIVRLKAALERLQKQMAQPKPEGREDSKKK
jgi:hypothetical protein